MTDAMNGKRSASTEEPRTLLNVAETVVAVVVTYNRLDLLPKTLAGVSKGELRPDCVVIVNNASDDGTLEYLNALDYEIPTDIVHLSQNVGGAGGFTVGIDRALMRHNADLVWIMDDDTEPTENTLSELYRAWAGYAEIAEDAPALVASRVVWTNGEDHPMNTMRTKFAASAQETELAQKVGARPIRSASFVSIMMDARVMRREGLPLADFFIWNDDFEYSTRLINHRVGIATSKSVVVHHTKTFGTTNANPGPRFYNDVRNKLWVFTRRRTLAPWEKALYGGSTARLWLSTVAKTDDKQTYASYLKNGLVDGARGFRSNEEVLAGIYNLEYPGASNVAEFQDVAAEDARFSVLMATYRNEDPAHLEQALASNITDQTLRPTEFVLVEDGPLTPELDAVIASWQQKAAEVNVDFKTVKLERNHGLARALNFGLDAVSTDIVARADSDDISMPRRFEKQLSAFLSSGVSVLGGSMEETDASGESVEAIRHALTGSTALAQAMVSRNPLFHPTVMFDVRDVRAVGGYEHVPGAEDYWLWARMVREGYKIDNIEAVLVRYRATSAFLKRGGLAALQQDFAIQSTLYRGHITSPAQYAKNLGVRAVYRALPTDLRANVFRTIIGGSRGKK